MLYASVNQTMMMRSIEKTASVVKDAVFSIRIKSMVLICFILLIFIMFISLAVIATCDFFGEFSCSALW